MMELAYFFKSFNEYKSLTNVLSQEKHTLTLAISMYCYRFNNTICHKYMANCASKPVQEQTC